MSKFFTPVPLDFDQAFKNGDLTPGAYLVGCHLAAESFRSKNTDGGVVTLHVASLAELCQVSPSTIRRALHLLERKGWIQFAVRERQQGPWRIRLTRLAMPDEEQGCVTPASPDPPLMTQAPASLSAGKEGANIHTEQGSWSPSLRPSRARKDETRRDDKKREKAKPPGKEKLDHAVGKTTSEPEPSHETEPEFPPLLDALEPDPFHENGRLLNDEEISDLGTASLGELHRRKESGEL